MLEVWKCAIGRSHTDSRFKLWIHIASLKTSNIPFAWFLVLGCNRQAQRSEARRLPNLNTRNIQAKKMNVGVLPLGISFYLLVSHPISHIKEKKEIEWKGNQKIKEFPEGQPPFPFSSFTICHSASGLNEAVAGKRIERKVGWQRLSYPYIKKTKPAIRDLNRKAKGQAGRFTADIF